MNSIKSITVRLRKKPAGKTRNICGREIRYRKQWQGLKRNAAGENFLKPSALFQLLKPCPQGKVRVHRLCRLNDSVIQQG
jgi:hypothetical protein